MNSELQNLLSGPPPTLLSLFRQEQIVDFFERALNLKKSENQTVWSLCGRSGCGKTVAVQKAVRNWIGEASPIPRFCLEVSHLESSIHDVLDRLPATLKFSTEFSQLDQVAIKLRRESSLLAIIVNDAERLVSDRREVAEWNRQLRALSKAEPYDELRGIFPQVRIIFTSQVSLIPFFGDAIKEVRYEASRKGIAFSVGCEDAQRAFGNELSLHPDYRDKSVSYLRAFFENDSACRLMGDSLTLGLFHELINRPALPKQSSKLFHEFDEVVRRLVSSQQSSQGPDLRSAKTAVEAWADRFQGSQDDTDGEQKSRMRILDDARARLRRRLYRNVIEYGRDIEENLSFDRMVLCRLLAIAAIDPRFENIRSEEWKTFAFKVLGDLPQHLKNRRVSPHFNYLFHIANLDGQFWPRLSHRTVLDLYQPGQLGDNWPYNAKDEEFDRQIAHRRAAEWLNRKESKEPDERLIDLRHRLRAEELSSRRYLSELDCLAADLRTVASQGLAWSYADVVARSNHLRPYVVDVAEHNAAGSWYQAPPILIETLPKRHGSSLEALANFGEMAYQALDAWSPVNTLANQCKIALETSQSIADPTKLEASVFLYCLYGSMAYDYNGNAKDARDTLTFFKSELQRKGLKSRYDWNIDANLMVAKLKADVADIPPLSAESWDKLLRETYILSQSLEVCLGEPVSGETIGLALDRFRIRVNSGRLIHYLEGYQRAIEHYARLIEDMRDLARVVRQDLALQIRTSQEMMYACLGYAFVLLCGNDLDEARRILTYEAQPAIQFTGDTWALVQARFLQAWIELMGGKSATLASDAFHEIANLFRTIDDAKSVHCSLYAAFVASNQPGKRPRAPAGEAFYKAIDEFRSKTRATAEDRRLIERWYAPESFQWLPIMPGALILRSVPFSYAPQVNVMSETPMSPSVVEIHAKAEEYDSERKKDQSSEALKWFSLRSRWIREAERKASKYAWERGILGNLRVTMIDDQALESFKATWRNGKGELIAGDHGFEWDEFTRIPYYREMADRFEAALYLDDRLVGLGIGEADLDQKYVARDFVERIADDQVPVKKHLVPLMNILLESWALVRGAEFIAIFDPDCKSVSRLTSLGFQYRDPLVELGSELAPAYYGYCYKGVEGHAEASHKFIRSPIDWLNLGEANDPFDHYQNHGKVPIERTQSAQENSLSRLDSDRI